MKFRRGTPEHPEGDHQHHHHEHEGHEHHELEEALNLARTKRGRKKLLIAGMGNAGMMAVAVAAAHNGGADPTWIEAAHDLGDTGYYLIPWFATLRHHLHHKGAVKWMRVSSYTAASLALLGMSASVQQAVFDGVSKPEAYTGPLQLGLAAGNAAIALYVGHEPGDTTIDHAALRHAQTDAKTSLVAAAGNFAARAFAVLNPLSALVVGGMTIRTEAENIRETNEALKQ